MPGSDRARRAASQRDPSARSRTEYESIYTKTADSMRCRAAPVPRRTINRTTTPFLREGVIVRVVNFRRLLAIIEEEDEIPPEQWRAEILSRDERLRVIREPQ